MSRSYQLHTMAIGLAAVASFAFIPGAALAQSAPVQTVPVPGFGGAMPMAQSITVMVVDADAVMGQSKAIKAIQTQVDAQNQEYTKEFSQKETDLETAGADLERQQRQLTADIFEEKRHALAKRQEEVQRDADTRKRSMQQGAAEAVDKIKRALVEVVQVIAQQRHANLVIQRAGLIYADPSFDATARDVEAAG